MKNEFELLVDSLGKLSDRDFSKYDQSFVSKLLAKRMFELNSLTEQEYLNKLISDNNEIKLLYYSLQISYSEFFRNKLTFEVLETVILPELILKAKNENRNEIRIWSAACSAGQEAYSLAIILKEVSELYRNKIKFRIFASDQSKEQISIAQKGFYSIRSLNNVSLARLNKWFALSDNHNYEISSELKQCIEFSEFDLFNNEFNFPATSIYGDFDLVFCANLLYYYKPFYQKKILDKMSLSLSEGGYVVTGEIERDVLLTNNYKEVFPYSAVFKKNF